MSLEKPTLLVDAQQVRENIAQMAAKAERANLQFRPHFKTHQSILVGGIFREYGVDKITVSSLSMAAQFAADGWRDITVAVPVNVRELERINRLAGQVRLQLLTDSLEATRLLQAGLRAEVGLFIKIDVGYHRVGVEPHQIEVLDELVDAIAANPRTRFCGFLTHAGQSYAARGRAEILAIHEASLAQMRPLRARYSSRFPDLVLSVGDTPTCSLAENFEGMDEIRPGNFVFYDVMQTQIGSCTAEQIALGVACPVIAKHAERGEAVLYGGAVHLSKDRILVDGRDCFGWLARWRAGARWELLDPQTHYLSGLSQEHGKAKLPATLLHELKIGDVLVVLPIHSCLAVAALGWS